MDAIIYYHDHYEYICTDVINHFDHEYGKYYDCKFYTCINSDSEGIVYTQRGGDDSRFYGEFVEVVYIR